MKDFIYNLRRSFLHSRRRHRPGMENFGLNFRKDPVFRLIVVLIALLATAVVVLVLMITVMPDNPVKAFFKGEDIKEIDMSQQSPTNQTTTPDPVQSATPTASPTQDPDEITPTPLTTEEEKATTTAWVTAASGLVVRTGPSTQHAKLGTIPFGAKIEIIEEGTWDFIEFEGGGGYVHSNYVYIGDSPPGITTQNTNTSQTWTHLSNSTSILVEKIFYQGITYYVAKIKTDAKNLFSAYSNEAKIPSKFLEGKSSYFAVNGDYYSLRDTGIIIRNGEMLRDENYDDIAVLYDDGRLEVYSEKKDVFELLDGGALQSWSFGPILVKDGVAFGDFEKYTDLNLPNPRTGIGMVSPGQYIIIVVDGRQEESKGVTLEEFSKLFMDYKCESAYNLYGGGTSIMFFEGEMISSPSGGEERSISDIIYIGN